MLWRCYFLLVSRGRCSLRVILLVLSCWLIVAKAHPVRVVSLAPNLTELVYAVGAGEVLVGASEYSDYPAPARLLPKIAVFPAFNQELLIQLQPSLILALPSQRALLDQLPAAIASPVHYIAINTIADIASAGSQIARALGRPAAARRFRADWLAQLQRIQAQYRAQPGAKKLRTFFQLSQQPLLTVNKTSLLSQALTLCGADNLFAELALPVATVSPETLLQAQPDVIVLPQHRAVSAADLPVVAPKATTVAVPADLILRPGPRFLLGIERLCQALAQLR